MILRGENSNVVLAEDRFLVPTETGVTSCEDGEMEAPEATKQGDDPDRNDDDKEVEEMVHHKEHEEITRITDNDAVTVVYQENGKEENDARDVAAAKTDDKFHTTFACARSTPSIMTMTSIEEDRMNDDSSNPRPFVESSGVENTNSGGIDGGTRALSDMDCTDVFWYVLLSDDVEEAPSVIMDGRITEHSHDDNNKSTLQKPDDVVHCNEKTIESPEYDNNVLRQEAIVDEGDDADSPKEDLTPVDDHEASGPINDHVGDDDNEESTRQKHDEIPEATMELPEYHEEAIFHEDDGAGTPKDDLVELDDHEAPVVKQDDTLDLYYFDDNQAYQGQKERQRCQVSICSIM
jgi:hypothetical protein